LDEVPQLVKDFLFEHIHGHEELEILVLVHQSGRQTEDSIAESLKISTPLVDDALKALCGRGLLERATGNGRAQYRSSDNWKQVCDELARLYASHRLELVRLMSANAIERVRTRAMRTFADCFFLGKRRDDG
jgi:predicted ArsR family transcriptional regulator